MGLGYEACQRGHSVLFTTAVDAHNNLVAAQAAQWLKAELKRYLAPTVLVLDELGYLPLDKTRTAGWGHVLNLDRSSRLPGRAGLSRPDRRRIIALSGRRVKAACGV